MLVSTADHMHERVKCISDKIALPPHLKEWDTKRRITGGRDHDMSFAMLISKTIRFVLFISLIHRLPWPNQS